MREPLICGKYFKAVFVRVARPEKAEKFLVPHLNFIKCALKSCKGIEVIYVLAAGKWNCKLAEVFAKKQVPLDSDLKNYIKGKEIEGFKYKAKYRGRATELYVARIPLKPYQ